MAALPSSQALYLVCLVIILSGFSSPTVTANEVEESQLPEGYVYHESIGMAYKKFDKKHTWENARKACNSEGAQLASIDSKEKFAFVADAVTDILGTWVGIHRSGMFMEWLDAEDKKIEGDLPWGLFVEGLLGNCVYADMTIRRGLVNTFCSWPLTYICELKVKKLATSSTHEWYEML